MTDYGVTFDTTPPVKFARAQVFLRILIIVLLSILAGAFGWISGLLYLSIPIVAAVLISQKGPERYLAESGDTMTKWLRIIVGFYAYLTMLTDRLPAGTDSDDEVFRFEVYTSGTPSTGNALLRLLLALPSAIVLSVLWIVGGLFLIIAAVSVLVNENYPPGLYDFIRALNRWDARLLAYLGSLVDAYPPFTLDTGATDGPAPETRYPGT